jgi:acetyl esterase/lipase
MKSLLSALFLCLGAVPVTSLAAPASVVVKSDVSFLAPGRKEKLDLYLPVDSGDATALRPVVVYFHGGGWVHGDKATDREKEIGGALAGAGYVFVSANYLLGQKVWPTNLEDCQAAVRFIRSHAAEYRVDPGRVALMGASAGGHLALLLAYTADESTRVKAVIDLYGITDLLTRRDVNPDGSAKDTLDNAHSAEMLGVDRRKGVALWKKASPVYQITPAAPPTLIIQGLADPIVDHAQSSELDQILTGMHIPHQLLFLPGIGHQFDLETWKNQKMTTDLRPVVIGFLGQYLK